MDMKIQQETDQPYLDGWLKDTPLKNEKINSNSKEGYLDGWLKNTLGRNKKSTGNSNSAYLDGWLKDTKDQKEKTTQNSNQAYLDGWLKDGQTKSFPNSNPAYLDGWLKDGQKPNSNQVYLDGWLKDRQAKSTPNTNQAYLDGWLKDGQKAISTPNSNQVYLDGWLKDNKDLKEKTIKQAYLDGWLKDSLVEKTKPTHISTQAYLDGWLKNSHAEPNDKLSFKVDHTEAFKLAFFALEDIYVGNVMTLSFPIREYANFLPKKVADSIPFSKSQVPSLLQLFKLTKDSPQGEDLNDIIDQCESPLQKGETKACPTSLESMVEFVHSVIGADTKYNVLTTQWPTTSGAALQNYTILEVSKDIYAPKWVACHPRPYPYALYYCHYLDIGSKLFKVLLKGQYGDIMDALAICHLDTS
ncbi:BURP domain-containing protein, partial [Trifolium pratense]